MFCLVNAITVKFQPTDAILLWQNCKSVDMDALERYLKKIDESTYDYKDVHIIDSELQEVEKQLTQDGYPDIVATAELERQVFSVRKSFDTKLDHENGTMNGLSWKFSGTQTLEDGSIAPAYWPDVFSYTQQAFEYFEKRYQECSNLFAKTEYGLMVYFGEKTSYSKHNDFKKQLCKELFSLSKQYYANINSGEEGNFNCLYFFDSLRLAFGIAEKANLNPELSDIIEYVFETHQNWDIEKKDTLRILLDLSGLMSEFYGKFKNRIDFQAVLDKNIRGAKVLEKNNIWGAMYTVDLNISIEQKRNKSASELLVYKAELYKKLASDAEKNSNMACVNFIDQALRIYQQLNDSVNVKRMEKKYSDLRGKFPLSEIRQDFPKEYVDDLMQRVRKTVANNDEKDILKYFIITPWYNTIQNTKDQSIEFSKKEVLMSMLSTTVMDKFGNMVEKFRTDEEKAEFNFWHSYSFNYQHGTQVMQSFFMEAYKAGKLNYNNVLSYLESTWYNEVIPRKYYGDTINVKPIDTLKPGLKRLFEELDKSFEDNQNRFDFVTITDSLTLKVEGILRYFCEKLGIATFKTRGKDPDKLVMEKLLDDLLADIAHKPLHKPDQDTNFDEEDRIFIKYVMSEKVGLNLRNKVAHGLMDVFEYSFEHIVVLFCIIMKLSKYKFVETKGD